MATILVVDDTPSIRFLIRMNLELVGHRVLEAVDGQDCLDQMAAVKPDAITMDLMMPRMNGVAAVEHIRDDEAYNDVAIIMVTTQQQHFDVNRASRAGVDGYVTKPFDPDTLVAVVSEALAARGRV